MMEALKETEIGQRIIIAAEWSAGAAGVVDHCSCSPDRGYSALWLLRPEKPGRLVADQDCREFTCCAWRYQKRLGGS